MPRRNIERELEALKALAAADANAQVRSALQKALRDRVNVIVAKAAEIACALEIRDLIPDLCTAFDRLLENASEADPQCWGKNAIAKALAGLGHSESEPFLRGVRHIQREPVWGRLVDTALTLRGTCALALVSIRDLTRREILEHLIRALTDSYEATDDRDRNEAAVVRRDAALAIEQMDGEEARLLLRLKARAGDPDPGVTGQIFDSLLRLEREAAIGFVVEFFDWPESAVQEEAALALGTSRLAGAIPPLEDAWSHARSKNLRGAILTAMSASGHENAIEFLLNIARNGREPDAVKAIRALGLHSLSEEMRARIRHVTQKRTEQAIAAAVTELN